MALAWYDPIIIFLALIGLVIMFLNSHHNKHAFHWGLVLFIGALILKAFLWFESLI